MSDTLNYVLRDPNDAADELDKMRERVAEMQYEAGMYQSLYEQSQRDLSHAKAMQEVWMNRETRSVESLRVALSDLLECAESECVSGSSYDPIEAAKAILSGDRK